jgi:hypothetical protein
VGERAGELAGGVSGKARIGVEGEDEPDPGELCRGRRDRLEMVRSLATEQRVQLGELSSLAFPPHPHALGRIPGAAAVEQPEPVAAGPGFGSGVQRANSVDRRRQQAILPRHRRGVGVVEIGQQGESKVRIGVGVAADLEAGKQLAHVLLVGEERGDDDERRPLGRQGVLPFELRKEPRGKSARP